MRSEKSNVNNLCTCLQNHIYRFTFLYRLSSTTTNVMQHSTYHQNTLWVIWQSMPNFLNIYVWGIDVWWRGEGCLSRWNYFSFTLIVKTLDLTCFVTDLDCDFCALRGFLTRGLRQRLLSEPAVSLMDHLWTTRTHTHTHGRHVTSVATTMSSSSCWNLVIENTSIEDTSTRMYRQTMST